MRLGGQLRIAESRVIGFDMNAAFALAQALGVNTFIVAELLPAIENIAITKMNETGAG